MRASSRIIWSLSSTTSLKVVAISPSTPVRSSGRRTEKSPRLKARSAISNRFASKVDGSEAGASCSIGIPPTSLSVADRNGRREACVLFRIDRSAGKDLARPRCRQPKCRLARGLSGNPLKPTGRLLSPMCGSGQERCDALREIGGSEGLSKQGRGALTARLWYLRASGHDQRLEAGPQRASALD